MLLLSPTSIDQTTLLVEAITVAVGFTIDCRGTDRFPPRCGIAVTQDAIGIVAEQDAHEATNAPT